MEYQGKYNIFDPSKIKTYPLSTRTNKVRQEDILRPSDVDKMVFDLPAETVGQISALAREIVSGYKENRPFIFFTGAHLIKNGLAALLADLVERSVVTLIAGNGATSIHDFELALKGETSEYVPQALEKGQFGMAYEFCYINTAISLGNRYKLGFGESLGKMICDESFRSEVLSVVARDDSPREFSYPSTSALAACYNNNIPFTVHVGIGTDVIVQHPSFDGQAIGGCSGRDFLIYVNEISKFTDGGIVINLGSAVTGPEVLLKAVSMAANIGKIPRGIVTADFDLRSRVPGEMTDESAQHYYFRDQKSVVNRVPQAFEGKGYYIQGNQKQTLPLLYRKIIEEI